MPTHCVPVSGVEPTTTSEYWSLVNESDVQISPVSPEELVPDRLVGRNGHAAVCHRRPVGLRRGVGARKSSVAPEAD